MAFRFLLVPVTAAGVPAIVNVPAVAIVAAAPAPLGGAVIQINHATGVITVNTDISGVLSNFPVTVEATNAFGDDTDTFLVTVS